MRRAAANPTPAARREAGSAIDERSMRGRRVSRHKRETLDPIADIRDVRGDPDWAVDALALAAAGARNEGLPHILFPMDDGGSSPDVHSGVSSGESSGDEGLSGDEGSDGAVEPALVRRDASRLAVESHAEHEAHDMDVDADRSMSAPIRAGTRATLAPGPPPPGALAETASPPATPPPPLGSMEAPSMETPTPARAMAALGASSNPPPRGGARLGGRPSPNACPPRRRGAAACANAADAHRVSEATVSHAPGGGERLYTRTDVRRAARPAGWAAFRAARLRRESPARPASFVSRRGARRDVRPEPHARLGGPHRRAPAVPAHAQLARAAVHRLGVFKTALGEVRARPEAPRAVPGAGKAALDPRRETLEVFPAGVLLVVDESALLSSDGVTERLAKPLGQAAAAAAGRRRRRGRVPLRRQRRARAPPGPGLSRCTRASSTR